MEKSLNSNHKNQFRKNKYVANGVKMKEKKGVLV